ncbi:MAG TPA: outer membrane protein assembly factor BamA [Acetobacteraceae bacterium]|nr:outer membrane protein assembly factor BamA [Acetobacteraceae bacterium]
MRRIGSALLAVAFCLILLPAPTVAQAPAAAAPAAGGQADGQADRIAAIRVVGNQRIETSTILSYMLLEPGDPFDPSLMDRSLKTLYATGLFSDVKLAREGNVLVVTVSENPVVNVVAFEGNHELTDAQLSQAITLRPRAVFTPDVAESDREKILGLYAQRGYYAATVVPKIIKLPENRVNVVFEINDGPATYISRIVFVGNHAFSASTLSGVISSREEAWWRFFSNADSYNPQRVEYDEELLRRFYLRNGYVDFAVTHVQAELSPDHRSFVLTFVLSEGSRYHVSAVSVVSHVPKVSGASLRSLVAIGPGDWYDGDAVQRSVQAISNQLQNNGFAFAEVHPDITRDAEKHTVALVFNVVEGPHVYIERIDITGNTRTEDQVIRRQFNLAEGDPFNAASIQQTQQRLKDLNYFGTVNITTSPGSEPDRIIVHTAVTEKATGEFTIGGGYSTDVGALVNVGLQENNIVGSGIDAGISGILAQRESSIDLNVTDPYFLGRNLLTGIDIYDITNNNQSIAEYSENRYGFTTRLGYNFNDHVSQEWSYSLVNRDIVNIATTASPYIFANQGNNVLSQIGTTLVFDWRDSKIDPTRGFVISGGADYAGIGGNADFVRLRADAAYYIPLDGLLGDGWGIAERGSYGDLVPIQHEQSILDNFYLGGANLRGFEDGGVGPHDISTGDSLGGRFLWTESTELRFPLPVNRDLGLSGRLFVDTGSDWGLKENHGPITDFSSPRVGAGFGISWDSPLGLLSIDLGYPVVKKSLDQTQVFRFGFGTRF